MSFKRNDDRPPSRDEIAIKQKNVIQSINLMKNQIAAALPKHITPCLLYTSDAADD